MHRGLATTILTLCMSVCLASSVMAKKHSKSVDTPAIQERTHSESASETEPRATTDASTKPADTEPQLPPGSSTALPTAPETTSATGAVPESIPQLGSPPQAPSGLLPEQQPPPSMQIQGRVEQSGMAAPPLNPYGQGPELRSPGMQGAPNFYAMPPAAAPFGMGGMPMNGAVQQYNSGMPPMNPSGYPPLNGYAQQMNPGLQQLAPLLQQLPAQLQRMGLPQIDAMPPVEDNMLQGNVDKNIKRPSWIPGYAYSNDQMATEYHNMDIFWWDKRLIPDKPQWMRLSPSVIKYWQGAKQYPYWVHTEPFKAAPGNFVFSSQYPGGPKGWLQYTGTPGRGGFPLYRYWFDPR